MIAVLTMRWRGRGRVNNSAYARLRRVKISTMEKVVAVRLEYTAYLTGSRLAKTGTRRFNGKRKAGLCDDRRAGVRWSWRVSGQQCSNNAEVFLGWRWGGKSVRAKSRRTSALAPSHPRRLHTMTFRIERRASCRDASRNRRSKVRSPILTPPSASPGRGAVSDRRHWVIAPSHSCSTHPSTIAQMHHDPQQRRLILFAPWWFSEEGLI